MIKRIHILGASGSGTSTLGAEISKVFGFTHLDTDNYYWLPTNPPFTMPRELEERIALMEKDIISAEKVVITGSLCGWGDVFIQYFDLVVHITTPTGVRVGRLEKREYQRYGKRILPGGDMYNDHIEFIKWAKAYDFGDLGMRSKTLHKEWLKKYHVRSLL